MFQGKDGEIEALGGTEQPEALPEETQPNTGDAHPCFPGL